MTSKVQVEIKAPVATITLNKPERLSSGHRGVGGH